MEFARGVVLKKLTSDWLNRCRSLAATQVERGDVMTPRRSRDATSSARPRSSATPTRQTVMTDMIFVGLGIVLGGLVGLLTLSSRRTCRSRFNRRAAARSISGSGIRLAARGFTQTFGRIPGSAMRIFDAVGLTCSSIGLRRGSLAGPSFLSGLRKSGVGLVFVGLVIAILPHAVSILFGRYVLKMNPVIVLGACCGAGTITAALRAVQEEADSDLPAWATPCLTLLAISCSRHGGQSWSQ